MGVRKDVGKMSGNARRDSPSIAHTPHPVPRSKIFCGESPMGAIFRRSPSSSLTMACFISSRFCSASSLGSG